MKVQTFTAGNVMKPIGPYSHIAMAGPFISISGIAGVNPATGELAGPDVYSQATQILESFRTMLAVAGSSLSQIMHVHVFLLNMDDFDELNRAYSEVFSEHQPARTVVGVSALPKKGALLTMNLNAVAGETAG